MVESTDPPQMAKQISERHCPSRAPSSLIRADFTPWVRETDAVSLEMEGLGCVPGCAALTSLSEHAWAAAWEGLGAQREGKHGRNVSLWLVQSAGALSCHSVLSFNEKQHSGWQTQVQFGLQVIFGDCSIGAGALQSWSDTES